MEIFHFLIHEKLSEVLIEKLFQLLITQSSKLWSKTFQKDQVLSLLYSFLVSIIARVLFNNLLCNSQVHTLKIILHIHHQLLHNQILSFKLISSFK